MRKNYFDAFDSSFIGRFDNEGELMKGNPFTAGGDTAGEFKSEAGQGSGSGSMFIVHEVFEAEDAEDIG